MMRRILISGMMGMFMMTTLSGFLHAQPNKGTVKTEPPATPSAVELRMAMRELWEAHVMYTRNYIISAVANLEDVGAIAGRLLKNQDDIGAAIKPVYGDAAGNKLAALLRDHITIAVDVVKAAKTGADADLAQADKKWHANADELAAFLSGANPNWPKKDLTDMLYRHLELTTGEVVARLKKDWTADIAAYDQGDAHMLMFADVLTKGILKQFPDKFKK
jgi:hypothetical protein